MQLRTFHHLKLISLLSLTSLLGACASPTYLSDAEPIMPAQPLLSDANCSCNFSALSMPKTDLRAVYFDTARSSIRASERYKLDNIANAIRFNNPTSVVLEGNADSRGGERYNNGLGQRRARTVRQALISRGISPNLLTIQSNGENRPVATNRTRQGQQMNRRVDVTLYLR